MPFGGPYLDTATIAVIRQWITNGAPPATASTAGAHFALSAVSPQEGSVMAGPALRVVLVFNHDLDASLVNYTTLTLDRLTAGGAEPVSQSLSLHLAKGNPRAVLMSPGAALGPGTYRVTVRGSGGGALADQNAQALDRDYSFEFTVDDSR